MKITNIQGVFDNAEDARKLLLRKTAEKVKKEIFKSAKVKFNMDLEDDPREWQQMIDTDSAWLEHIKIKIRLPGKIRNKIEKFFSVDPAKFDKDPAQQKLYKTSKFTLILSKQNHLMIIGKSTDWSSYFFKLMRNFGLNDNQLRRLYILIFRKLPNSEVQIEMPVLDTNLRHVFNNKNASIEIITKWRNEIIVSRINFSTNIDIEIRGKLWLIQRWISVMAASQHALVLSIAHIYGPPPLEIYA